MKSSQVSHTLFDRTSIAIFSALLAFVTGTVVWFMLGYLFGYEMASLDSYRYAVGGFTIVMAVLGFLTATNLVASIFGGLWTALHGVAKWWF